MRGILSYYKDEESINDPYTPNPLTIEDYGDQVPKKITSATYSGKNRRNSDRYELSAENQELVNVLNKKIQCKDNCIIPRDARPHVQHQCNDIKDSGDGSYSTGINRHRDQHNKVISILETINYISRIVLKVVVTAIVISAISYFAVGFIYRLRQGVGI